MISEELKRYKERTGLTNPQIAEMLGIPLRTFEDWKSGHRTPPDYVQTMITKLLKDKG